MNDEHNPYRSPIADPPSGEPNELAAASPPVGEQGVVGPMLLSWIGVLLAIGIVGTIAAAIVLSTYPGVDGVLVGFLGLFALLTPPLRLAWVIFAAIQRRRYQASWEPGGRTFLLVIFIINVVLLCLDAVLILLVATCFSMLM